MRQKWQVAVVLAVVAGLVTVGAIWYGSTNKDSDVVVHRVTSPFHGATFDPPIQAPDFTLTNHLGEPFRLHDHQGEVVVLFFGFTSCPDVCPTTLAHFRHVKQYLEEDADRVNFVMVTVDPERDSQERMAQYMQAFDKDFIGLTGTLEETKVVWDLYDVRPEKVEVPGSALGYSVTHPASSFVVDTEGNLRLIHFYGMPADVVAEDLQRLLS